MKLHVVAATDIIQKGLDLSYPHHQLGEDGLLVPPQNRNIEPVTVPPVSESVPESVDVPVAIQQLEPIEVPEPIEPSKSEVLDLDVPAVEEEKKIGKKSKKS